jgi:hypothetical protein
MRPTDCVTDTEYPLVVSGHPTEVNVTMPLPPLSFGGALLIRP